MPSRSQGKFVISGLLSISSRRLQSALFADFFSALAEFDQNVQITILPNLQWADLFSAPGSIYSFTCVGIPSDSYDALVSPHNNHKSGTIGNDGGCGDSSCGGIVHSGSGDDDDSDDGGCGGSNCGGGNSSSHSGGGGGDGDSNESGDNRAMVVGAIVMAATAAATTTMAMVTAATMAMTMAAAAKMLARRQGGQRQRRRWRQWRW